MTVEVIKAEVATVSHQEEEKMKVVDEVVEVCEVKKDVEEAKPESVEKISSFKEESNFVSDLKDHEKKALSDLKAMLEEAILGNSLFKKDEVKVEEKKEECVKEEEEVKVEEVQEKEVEKVEGEESSKKSGEKKGLNKLKSTIQEAFKGHSLFKKDEVKVEEVVEEKAKVEEDCVKEEVEKVEDVEVKESEKVEEKEKCVEGGEETSKKSGEKKGLNKLKSTIQEAFKGHSLFKKDEVKVEEVVEEKAKVEEGKKEDDCVKEEVEKVEEAVEVKEVEKVEEKEKCVEGGEESSQKSVEKKGLNKLKSKIGEAFKGHSLFKKDEPKVEEVVEEKPKVEEEKKGEEKEEEKKEECAKEVVQEDVKEKESETVEEKEKVEEGEESSKKSVEKKGLNKFKSTIQEAFKGHLFSKKSKKEVEEKKEESKSEGADKVEEEAKPESCEKVEEESKPECEEKVEEKQEEAAVEVVKTEVCEVKEPEAVVEEVAEEIKTEECEEEKKVEEVVEVCEEEKKVEEVVEVCEEETKVEEVVEVCEEEKKVEEVVVVDKNISLWGVPLLPSKADEGTDVVLLKFLRARDFKVSEAFKMLKKTLEWRKELKIDSILDEDMGNDLSMAGYMSGVDREGHPICYNIFGVLDDEELYQKTLGSEEKRDSFLRWRFQLMERGIQKLEFKPTGVTSLLQITDLKNSPGPAKKEVRIAIKQALGLLQDNYPEFMARTILINVPFWYYAYKSSTLLTQRSKSKLVLARPAKVTETLLKYIPIEEIPIQYGGLKRDNDFEFSAEDCLASELIIKPTSTATIEIPAPQAGTTFIWDITVLGWDVNYKEEFVPTDECSYTIIVQKQKKLGSIEGPIRNTFRTTEPGKIVLTIENCSNKKKKVFYRHKVKKSAF